MKTSTTHDSNLGKFAFWDGYLEYHDHPRYKKMSEEELEEMEVEHRYRVCRNAARLERAVRRLEQWRRGETV